MNLFESDNLAASGSLRHLARVGATLEIDGVEQLLLRVHAGLAVDAFNVRLHGAFRDMQLIGDIGAVATAHQNHENVALARREAARVGQVGARRVKARSDWPLSKRS